MGVGLNQKWDRSELDAIINNTKGTVIHNDLDGLLSGLYIYQKYNIPIVGICELGTNNDDIGCLSINSEFYDDEYRGRLDWESILFLDCGVICDKAKVIDHHSSPNLYYNERKINYCKYFSKTDSITDKCPLGNILWLMAIHNEDVSLFNELQQRLIIAADGTHSNYFNYPENTKYALETLGLIVLEGTIKKYGKERYRIIDSELEMNLDPFFRSSKGFLNGLNKSIFDVANNINRIMNWSGNAFMVKNPKRIRIFTYVWKKETHPVSHSKLYETQYNTFTHTITQKDESRSTIIEIWKDRLIFPEKFNSILKPQLKEEDEKEIECDVKVIEGFSKDFLDKIKNKTN